ncbi:right-handed parallel beta-helix repeat-containing protein [Halomarina halobia]|uniref:Right-handed parallel beta-helix repeat-containing protein n=1 Tax=Halomarina halobia TaxID=3033386 RepID=A0ABD6AD22_9EURY|nr:right-handed parallel beta-helix repeat-containing protein [Halomarina sp. PSR21]
MALRQWRQGGVALVVFFIASSAVTGAAPPGPTDSTSVDSCTTIDMPGEYVVTEDLSADGTCLTITADDVTLDGAGHELSGNGTGTGVVVGGENVTVRNVTATGFDAGADLDGQNSSVVESTFSANRVGVTVTTPRNATLSNNTVVGNAGDGVNVLLGSVTLDGNRLADNGGYGLATAPGEATTLIDNVVENNSKGGLLFASGTPTLRDNQVRDNGGDGVFLDEVSGATLANNTVTGNDGVGLAVAESTDVGLFATNLSNNAGDGIRVAGTLDVSNSTITDNGGDGIHALTAQLVEATDVTVSDTVIERNAGDAVGGPAAGNVTVVDGPNANAADGLSR